VQMLALLTCSLAVQVPIMMVGGIVMAMREDLGLSWLLAVVVPALFLSVGLVVSQMVPSFRQVQSRIDDVNRILREQISGIRVVRAFVREPRERQRFADANDGLTDVSIRAGRWMATMFPLVMLVVNISSVAVIWYGGHRVDAGLMQVGSLTAFLSYLMQILMSVMMGTFMLMQIPRSAVCADRIGEVLTLIHLRAQNPALARGTLIPLTTGNPAVVAYLRREGGRAVAVVANLGDAAVRLPALSSGNDALERRVYGLSPVMGGPLRGPKLRVDAGGRIDRWVPVARLQPRQVNVIVLSPGLRIP